MNELQRNIVLLIDDTHAHLRRLAELVISEETTTPTLARVLVDLGRLGEKLANLVGRLEEEALPEVMHE
jgi:hypothetical protein